MEYSRVSDTSRAPLGAGVMRRLGLLAASLRAGGVRVGVGELLSAHRALAAVDPASRSDAYNALRTVLCSRKSDLEVFDAAFVEAFGEPYVDEPPRGEIPESMDLARMVLPRTPPIPPEGPPNREPTDLDPRPSAWSDVELLREKDFAEYTADELEKARRLIARLATRAPQKPSRRTKPAHRRG